MSSQERDIRETVVTTIRLPREQHEQLTALAEKEHRSFAGELRRLVDIRLAEADEVAA